MKRRGFGRASVEETIDTRAAQGAFQFLSPPRTLPTTPSLLQRALPFVLGAIIGLSLGLGAVALVTWLDPVIHSQHDLMARLKLQTVAVVPPRARSR